MNYLENPKRESIRNWYPEAQSVVLAALFYKGPAGSIQSAQQKNQGRIASYALYKDYHDVMIGRMKKALEEIREQAPQVDGKVFVDASPILERSYARLAGLGWIGKNTMLINKKHGSYFFLGGMAVNARLDPDPWDPLDHCGTCTRCLEACPTQCLTPHTLDASRCIAYLTIEKKTIPLEPDLAQKTGSWIFGCDICQQVCPFNRKQPQEKNRADGWEPKIPEFLDLKTILNWTQTDYRRHFAGLPVLRAKWRPFLRNAIIAAANTGNADFIRDLCPWMQGTDAELSALAHWAVARLETSVAKSEIAIDKGFKA